MGISICPKQLPSTNQEVLVQLSIKRPPFAVKLEKILKIELEDDTIEREDSPQLAQLQKTEMDELKMSFTAQQSEEIDNTISHPWLKKSYPQPQCNESLVKNDLQNASFEPNSSSFDLLKPKSILRIHKNGNPNSEHISNDQQSIASIKSNKKVSFDKQVQFSNFRKH
ncbi:unnamed protein product (macronuclear) [Paramecium tetraurelia]|uniref:Uncharacterized protein n=1 Tax=Paramecium tetraurelia TaxID=5888 RepID=A0E965_PARTE|nr:uncharacterized protein GSPATT00024563001 [Paramecium tetraurelia]CAK91832.1 unnamed protein product [Paramecium tetraurelia]|eukprot:XP_001459229.1 hypothetical protein (macronuclear) [Paramecium tetraurelia strain d4-2]